MGSRRFSCTATQPAFETAAKAIDGGWSPQEISSRPDALAETLKRTTIKINSKASASDWPDIAKELILHDRVLCVVNTRAQAAELFQLLPKLGRFHLSAAMCAAHRSDKLEVICQRLAEDKICRLISTQLIEAGVDVDFPIAYRAHGPLDSIIQTAGRCNREGPLARSRSCYRVHTAFRRPASWCLQNRRPSNRIVPSRIPGCAAAPTGNLSALFRATLRYARPGLGK